MRRKALLAVATLLAIGLFAAYLLWGRQQRQTAEAPVTFEFAPPAVKSPGGVVVASGVGAAVIEGDRKSVV